MIKRRNFLGRSLLGLSLTPYVSLSAQEPESPAPSILLGSPLIAGPDGGNMAILQAVTGPASGKAEISIDGKPWQTVLPESKGMVAFASHVLKFPLPPLPSGTKIRYRVSAWPVKYKSAYSIEIGTPSVTEDGEFRTLDPLGQGTRFAMWNDTHEQLPILRELHARTAAFAPDFLLWNGDQTDDVHDPAKMARQFICPDGLAIAGSWPMSYLRGNHDVRGPAARFVEDFTHCPGNDFTHAFRSGPVACLTMDTGEDKPDSHPVFAGMVAFGKMRERQTEWLKQTIAQPWFKEAPYKLLFCHIPLWWKEEKNKAEYYMHHQPCRDAWLDLLVTAGVRLVISGHTHEDVHLPKNDTRPIAQLVAGGRTMDTATLTTFEADQKSLRIRMQRLDGTVVQSLEIAPA